MLCRGSGIKSISVPLDDALIVVTVVRAHKAPAIMLKRALLLLLDAEKIVQSFKADRQPSPIDNHNSMTLKFMTSILPQTSHLGVCLSSHRDTDSKQTWSEQRISLELF